MDVEEIDETGVMTFLDDYEVHGVSVCKFVSGTSSKSCLFYYGRPM